MRKQNYWTKQGINQTVRRGNLGKKELRKSMSEMSQTKTLPSHLAKVKAGAAAEAIVAVRAQKTKKRATKRDRIYLTLRY